MLDDGETAYLFQNVKYLMYQLVQNAFISHAQLG
jgi:hypothetical protein